MKKWNAQRLIRNAKRAAFAAFVLVIVIDLASIAWTFTCAAGPYYLGITHGRVLLGEKTDGTSWRVENGVARAAELGHDWWSGLFRKPPGQKVRGFAIPLWNFAVTALVVAAPLWWLDRRGAARR